MKAYMLRNKTTGKYYVRRGDQSSPAVWTSKQGPASARAGRFGSLNWEIVEFKLIETCNDSAYVSSGLPE